jgi:hypothetical protein
MTRPADVRIEPYDVARHRAGTKGAGGRCSWTEDCQAAPKFTAVVKYTDSGRRYTWALCTDHERRVKDFFNVR